MIQCIRCQASGAPRNAVFIDEQYLALWTAATRYTVRLLADLSTQRSIERICDQCVRLSASIVLGSSLPHCLVKFELIEVLDIVADD